MIVVDASIWVSVALTADRFHDPSRTSLDTQVSGGERLVAPSLVLVEVSGAIARRSGNVVQADAAVRRLETTPGLRLESMEAALVREATRLAADLGLRGADALYVATAARFACPLVTWDAEVIRKTAGVVEAREPSS